MSNTPETKAPAPAAPPAPAEPAAAAPAQDEDDAIFNEAIANIEKRQAAAAPKAQPDDADEGLDEPLGDPAAPAAAPEGTKAEVAPAAEQAKPAEAAKPAMPKPEELKVGGDTPEEIRANVETLAKALGYNTKEEIDLIFRHNVEKRWADTRKSYLTAAQELAELKAKLAAVEAGKDKAKKPDSPASGAQDPGDETGGEDDWKVGMSAEEKALVETNPELLSMFEKAMKHQNQRAEALARKILAEVKVVESQKLDEVRAAEAATAWRSGVNALVPDGLALYYSPEFVAWENQNKARLSSLLKNYSQYDPQGTALEIRLYQQDVAAATKDRQTKADVLASATAPQGRKTAAAATHDDESDEDVEWDKAAKAAEKRQRERSGGRR